MVKLSLYTYLQKFSKNVQIVQIYKFLQYAHYRADPYGGVYKVTGGRTIARYYMPDFSPGITHLHLIMDMLTYSYGDT